MKILIIALAFLTPLSTLFAQKYKVDPGHTAFTTKVIRFGVLPVLGRFNEVSGEVIYDIANPEATKASIIIKVNSYSANNTGGEDAVKSEAFLDAKKFPEIKFILNSLMKVGNQMMAKGTLELHGTAREIECPVMITGPMTDLPTRKQSIGISGNLTVNRVEYGVGAEMKLPNDTEIIGNDVVIEFLILALSE